MQYLVWKTRPLSQQLTKIRLGLPANGSYDMVANIESKQIYLFSNDIVVMATYMLQEFSTSRRQNGTVPSKLMTQEVPRSLPKPRGHHPHQGLSKSIQMSQYIQLIQLLERWLGILRARVTVVLAQHLLSCILVLAMEAQAVTKGFYLAQICNLTPCILKQITNSSVK